MKLCNIKTKVQNIFQNFQYLNLLCQKPFSSSKEIPELIVLSCETNKYTSLSTSSVNCFSIFITINVIYPLTSIALKHILFLLILGDFYFYTNIPVNITCLKFARLETLPSLVLITAGLILLCSNRSHKSLPSKVINK